MNINKGVKSMEHNKHIMHDGHNDSIGCSVTECKYHCNNENFCTLEQIKVAKHEPIASSIECTDCQSFDNKQ